MTELIYARALARPVGSGPVWTTRTARFPYTAVYATIQLSYYQADGAERFHSFDRRYAHSYIETPLTPTMLAGPVSFPLADRFKDSVVKLSTDWVTFQLTTVGVTAVAVAMVWDRQPNARPIDPLVIVPQVTFDLAIHDEAGNVVGTHQEEQLPGGRPIDPEEVLARTLARAQANSDVRLRATIVDLSQLPEDRGFRIDTSSGRAFPLEPEASVE